MGRGNECEIRVESPSISRNHACITKKYGDYHIFDNKSKFGTLVREAKIYLEIDSTRKGVQIDRSVFMFSICKKNYLNWGLSQWFQPTYYEARVHIFIHSWKKILELFCGLHSIVFALKGMFFVIKHTNKWLMNHLKWKK